MPLCSGSCRCSNEVNRVLSFVIEIIRDEIRHHETLLDQVTPGYRANAVAAPVVSATEKKPFIIELIGNRAVLVSEDNFDVRRGQLQSGETVLVFTRTKPGEDLPSLKDPASTVWTAIARLDRTDRFVFCLVNSDSFAAFREVRTIAQQYGLEVGWEPIDTTNGKIVFGGTGAGRKPQVQR